MFSKVTLKLDVLLLRCAPRMLGNRQDYKALEEDGIGLSENQAIQKLPKYLGS